MDTLLDLLFEFFFEIFGEGFISLATAFLPNRKISYKARTAICIVCVIIAGILLFGLVIGIAILAESKGKDRLGWLLISLAVLYMMSGIILKIVFHFKNRSR